ncbi:MULTISPECIES: hypothetical protein [unclassified Tatumella]|uniref:hypothetical protein n=1 Tax=unclassified Tatumella TaxID=2649542 RepID=UPI001BAFFF4F|nr:MULTISPECIES: hypothetical protein [unclassified Tatumella]MBS0878385.1 hypothetical protein [Tatumella sp. JGM82]MBS0891181.1 hypothetical protein [Tatumella sp. JGM94]MBS0902738.1 hypothetical protein [Tatumella sp. JGM100]
MNSYISIKKGRIGKYATINSPVIFDEMEDSEIGEIDSLGGWGQLKFTNCRSNKIDSIKIKIEQEKFELKKNIKIMRDIIDNDGTCISKLSPCYFFIISQILH